MATQGDLDKTAMSKIYSVVDALDTANEVRKHQPDGAYVFAAKWTYLLWQDNWCNLYVDYFAQTKVISLKHKGYELIIFCFCFKEPRTIYEGPNFGGEFVIIW